MGKGQGHGEGHGLGSGWSRGKTERVAVPAMPMPLAILFCVLNFLIPGFGTICAGFTVFCCARNEDMTACKRIGSCCISFGIGLLQLLTVALLFIGWIWSCVWGVFFIGMSSEYYHDNPPDGDRGRVLQGQQQTTVVVQPGASVNPYQQGQAGYQQGQPGYQQQPQGQWPAQYPQPQPQYPQHQPQPPPQPAQPYPGQPYPGMPPQQYGQPQPSGPPSYAGPYGGELPPPYTENPQASPSAPPPEKM